MKKQLGTTQKKRDQLLMKLNNLKDKLGAVIAESKSTMLELDNAHINMEVSYHA